MAEAIDKLSHVLTPAKYPVSTIPSSSPVRVIESRFEVLQIVVGTE